MFQKMLQVGSGGSEQINSPAVKSSDIKGAFISTFSMTNLEPNKKGLIVITSSGAHLKKSSDLIINKIVGAETYGSITFGGGSNNSNTHYHNEWFIPVVFTDTTSSITLSYKGDYNRNCAGVYAIQ